MDVDSSEDEAQCESAESQDFFPEKSRRHYQMVYNSFTEWRQANDTVSFSEDTFLAYFKDMTKKYKSSTLLTHYSMLKSALNSKHNINIEPYARVRAFLKRHSEGYQPRKSQAFTEDEINKFINKAPDYRYLAIKVGSIPAH